MAASACIQRQSSVGDEEGRGESQARAGAPARRGTSQGGCPEATKSDVSVVHPARPASFIAHIAEYDPDEMPPPLPMTAAGRRGATPTARGCALAHVASELSPEHGGGR